MLCCRCPSPSDLPPKAAVAYRILDHTETLRSKGTTQQNRDGVQGDIEVLLRLGLGEGPRKQLGRSQVQTVRGAVDSVSGTRLLLQGRLSASTVNPELGPASCGQAGVLSGELAGSG